MEKKPSVLVQWPGDGGEQNESGLITAIAVYNGNAPLSVSIRRVFDGATRFDFPTEVTEGISKTRIVYSYNKDQWKELLQACTMSQAQIGLKQIMIPLLLYFRETYPGDFGDIDYDGSYEPEQYAEIVKLK